MKGRTVKILCSANTSGFLCQLYKKWNGDGLPKMARLQSELKRLDRKTQEVKEKMLVLVSRSRKGVV